MYKKWANSTQDLIEQIDMNNLHDEINDKAPPHSKVEATFEAFNDDMYYIMMDKNANESAAKVKAAKNRDGLKAYHEIFWWYVTTTGAALQEKSKRVSCPSPIIKEESCMAELEAWEEELKVLDQYDDAYHLNDQAKLVALEM